MLKLHSISFQDEATGKTITVPLNGDCVTCDQSMTEDEFFTASLYAGAIAGGGITGLMELHGVKKE